MAATREQYLYMAKLAEKSERFENMMEYMENVALAATVAEEQQELTAEERNLLAVAYKNVVGALRNSLSTISTIEQKQEDQGNLNRLTAIQSFRERIETEFSSTCGRILDFIETTLIPKSGSNVSKVFYLKMKGDYYRYLAESKIGFDQREDIAEKTLSSYEIAQEAARAEFPPTHPIRLGVALNFSVFYYKILYSPVKACSMARQAYDEAAPELDKLQGDSFKESTVIMQRLRENLAIWTSDMQEGESEEDQ